MPKKTIVLLPETERILEQMGLQIKYARLRRKLTSELVAERAGISRAYFSIHTKKAHLLWQWGVLCGCASCVELYGLRIYCLLPKDKQELEPEKLQDCLQFSCRNAHPRRGQGVDKEKKILFLLISAFLHKEIIGSIYVFSKNERKGIFAEKTD